MSLISVSFLASELGSEHGGRHGLPPCLDAGQKRPRAEAVRRAFQKRPGDQQAGGAVQTCPGMMKSGSSGPSEKKAGGSPRLP